MEKQTQNFSKIFYGSIENVNEYLMLIEKAEVIYNPTTEEINTAIIEEKEIFLIFDDIKSANIALNTSYNIIVIGNKFIKNGIHISEKFILDLLEKKFNPLEERKYFLDFLNNYLKKKNPIESISSLYWKFILLNFNREEFEKSISYTYSKLDTILFIRKEQFKIKNFLENKRLFFSMILQRIEKSFLMTGNKSLPYYYLCVKKYLEENNKL